MRKRRTTKKTKIVATESSKSNSFKDKNHSFHLEFLTPAQKMAWGAFDQHDVLFLLGSAGVGKSHLACAFAISEILAKRKKKIVLTRPIVEAGESLGYLPGDINEKTLPYMLPLYDCIKRSVGEEGPQKEIIDRSVEIAPVAYLRGRAETLDSLLVTPKGLIKMGDIKIDDLVIGSNGKPIKVTGVFPQGKKKIWKIIFSDKTYVKCSEDHLWSTMSLYEKRHNKGFSVKSTKDIIKNIKNKHGQKVHRVPLLSGCVEFESREISINPYLMGIMLGDGHIRETILKLSTNDQEILDYCSQVLPKGMIFNKQNKYDYNIIFDRHKRNPLLAEFKKYGLAGKKSQNKFVPENYKINSEDVRLEVLRGLMDSDGSVFVEKKTNKVRTQFYTTSKKLAEDVMFLVRSLGGYAYSRKREFDESDSHMYEGHVIKHAQSSYVVDIRLDKNPFKLKRKADKFDAGVKISYVKLISSVEYIGEEECQCISVDADDRLYLTNGFNITHNTFHDSVCIFDEAQNATKQQLKLFLTRFGQNSKVIITGDPEQSDLRASEQGLIDVVKKLEDLPGVGVIYFKPNSIVRHSLIADILSRLKD